MLELFQFLTQFFFVLSVTLLPITVVSLIYGKVSGSIVFHVEEAPSLFKQNKPNPAVGERPQPWYEEQKRLLSAESGSPVTSDARAPTEEVTSVQDFSPTGERKPRAPAPPAEATQEEKNEEEQSFQLVEKVFVAEVTEDVEKRTTEGIPIKITKGTKVKVAAPGVNIDEIGTEETAKEKEKEKKMKKLEQDPDLGTVTE